MSYEVSLNHPDFPKDFEFAINGLGVIPNGGTLKVDEDMERLFVAQRGLPLKDALGGNPLMKVTGTTSLPKAERDDLIENSTAAVEGGES